MPFGRIPQGPYLNAQPVGWGGLAPVCLLGNAELDIRASEKPQGLLHTNSSRLSSILTESTAMIRFRKDYTKFLHIRDVSIHEAGGAYYEGSKFMREVFSLGRCELPENGMQKVLRTQEAGS